MNKIYTSILCIALLAPISAQAEICTDFDENFNIIEFDCAEGVEAARKRIAAEQAKAKSEAQQKAEQERIEREKLAEQEQLRKAAERAERERQQELERAEREKQKAAERAERERQQELERVEHEKQKAAERAEREKQKAAKRAEREARFQQKQQEITQGGCWKFVVGLGGDFWSGTDLSSGVYVGESLDGGYVLDAGYSVGGATLNAELGARYYLKNSPNWFLQIGLGYTSPLDHEIEIHQLSPYNHIDSLYMTTTMYSLQAMAGRMMWRDVYLYGKLGISYVDYAVSGNLWFDSFGLKDTLSYTLGAGLEYSMWTWTSVYAGVDFVIPSGDTFKYADTLTSVNAGIRFQF